LAEAPKRAARNTIVLSSVALAVTGISVGAGMLGKDAGSITGAPAAADIGGAISGGTAGSSTSSSTQPSAAASASVDTHRTPELTRGYQRPAADPAKVAGFSDDRPAAITQTRSLAQSDPKSIAQALLGQFGWSSDQFGCLDSLWTRESGWNLHAYNPSGAYGIPQSLPGSKMASAGPDWQNNAETQIKWGLGYIQERYGSPCGAWAHSESNGWY